MHGSTAGKDGETAETRWRRNHQRMNELLAELRASSALSEAHRKQIDEAERLNSEYATAFQAQVDAQSVRDAAFKEWGTGGLGHHLQHLETGQREHSAGTSGSG
jgi:Tfp pilus assembly protein PilN